MIYGKESDRYDTNKVIQTQEIFSLIDSCFD